jgi:glycosyltransferase involved in cell wall biosynthesis
MRIFIFATCWNEMRLLPSFLRYYDPFVDRYYILDDGSSDGSVEFLQKQSKVVLLRSNRGETPFIENSRQFWNTRWKEMRDQADWILPCNIDEFVYHPDLVAYLKRCREEGVTLLPADGYEMVAIKFPAAQGSLCDEVRFGSSCRRLAGISSMYDKIMMFDPQAIRDINFSAGRHSADPVGRVVSPRQAQLKLLHYKYLGIDYVVKRYAELRSGLPLKEGAPGPGAQCSQYLWDRRAIRHNHQLVTLMAGVVVPVSPWQDFKLFLTFLPWKALALLQIPVYFFSVRFAKALRLIRRKLTA